MDANPGPSKAVHITKFTGHSHEDPIKFLDELDSYLILHRIKMNATDLVVRSPASTFNRTCSVVVQTS